MAELRLKEKQTGAPLPTKSDDENLILATSVDSVDALLAEFYGKFPLPWEAIKFDYVEDEEFEREMINQDLGDWSHQRIGKEPQVWIGGCGTNQAIQTALRFRGGRVIGSDVSAKSLEICGRNAQAVHVSNLELREESINQASYKEQFDYVISTGVIHHNANPQGTLERLAQALKPDGVLELMVYNRFHRLVTSSFQKAVRIFGDERGSVDFDADLLLARKIINSVAVNDVLKTTAVRFAGWDESDLADLVAQPVEHSYTVESLEKMAANCGLELIAPCISMFVKAIGSFFWNLTFADEELQEQYDALPDSRRWQITNLLLHEQSPALWFYFQRTDPRRPKKPEKQICDEFLRTRFVKTNAIQRTYLRSEDGQYRLSPSRVSYPLAAPHPLLRQVHDAVEGKKTMNEVLNKLGIDQNFNVVNRIRIMLATSAFPYLKALPREAQ
jgi:SAM-dependent methyltransferase